MCPRKHRIPAATLSKTATYQIVPSTKPERRSLKQRKIGKLRPSTQKRKNAGASHTCCFNRHTKIKSHAKPRANELKQHPKDSVTSYVISMRSGGRAGSLPMEKRIGPRQNGIVASKQTATVEG